MSKAIPALVQAKQQAFENVEEILTLLCLVIPHYEWPYSVLAQEAGVSTSTISNIVSEKTKSPHLRTVLGLLIALGFRVEIRKGTKKNPGSLHIYAKVA